MKKLLGNVTFFTSICVEITIMVFRLSYALYSSFGCLDLDCSDALSLGILKALLCAPVQLSLRPAVLNTFDRAWQDLVEGDKQILQYLAKQKENQSNAMVKGKVDNDPDEIKIPFVFFQRLLHGPLFSQLLATKSVYGRRGKI